MLGENISSVAWWLQRLPLRSAATKQSVVHSAGAQLQHAGCRAVAQQAGAAPPASGIPETEASLVFGVAGAPNHCLPGHVERPERVIEILRSLSSAGIIDSTASAAFEGQVSGLRPPRWHLLATRLSQPRTTLTAETDWCSLS